MHEKMVFLCIMKKSFSSHWVFVYGWWNSFNTKSATLKYWRLMYKLKYLFIKTLNIHNKQYHVKFHLNLTPHILAWFLLFVRKEGHNVWRKNIRKECNINIQCNNHCIFTAYNKSWYIIHIYTIYTMDTFFMTENRVKHRLIKSKH